MEKGVLPLIYIRRGRNAKERQHYTPEEKVAILRRHLLDKVPVSDLCEELGLQPTVFYRWQKEFFENGAAALQSKERPARQVEEKQKRIEFLEKKVQTKDEVLAELMAEHITKKKVLGSSDQSVGAARCAGPGGGFRPALVGEDGDRRRHDRDMEPQGRGSLSPLRATNRNRAHRLTARINGWGLNVETKRVPAPGLGG
jgi:transposase